LIYETPDVTDGLQIAHSILHYCLVCVYFLLPYVCNSYQFTSESVKNNNITISGNLCEIPPVLSYQLLKVGIMKSL